VPQILLSGNSLYTSQDFYRDLLARHEYGMWLDTRIKAAFAGKSISWADYTVAPTRAFADELHRWTGKDVIAIHHGFDSSIFFADSTPLRAETRLAFDSAKDALKLLYVSHYNYFRNFETLFRALPLIRQKLPGRKVRLLLTCKLATGQNPGAYKTTAASLLLKQLGITQEVIELGAIAHQQMHHIYRSCDLYVAPSYAETFAHPLVEASACGLPIVASDLAVHREVCGMCGTAARYFSRFSHEELAERVLQTIDSGSLTSFSSAAPVPFSWREHVDSLIQLAESLVHRRMAVAA
jgi:glycosyltransferase involved in cell wall biosynthesis